MSDEYEFPRHWSPDYEKDYAVAGSRFTVQVKAHGIVDGRYTWTSCIVVKGNCIHTGPFYWDPNKRDLTNENVCNHLATFWGHNPKVKEAQKMPASLAVQLDEIVEKCAHFMFVYFLEDPSGKFDYDIIQKHMDYHEWLVVLQPNIPINDKEYLVVFHNDTIAERGVKFTCFEQNRTFFTII